MLGVRLRAALPNHHLNSDAKDVVKLAMGLVATMTALVLGLLVAAAKGSYDTQKTYVIQMSAKVAFLDRVLAIYGPEAAESRAVLRQSVDGAVAKMWPATKSETAGLDPNASAGTALFDAVQKLSPQTDAQRTLKSSAVQMMMDLGLTRWLLFEQSDSAIATPLLVVVICWLTITFISFGLFAPSNATVIGTLMVAALSVAAALFLILELDQPFDGLIRISSAPMEKALQHLDR
jgi:hypothetical protein